MSEVLSNERRQTNVDLARCSAIVFMVLIHVLMRYGADLESGFGSVANMFLGGFMAAPVFMCTMGLGLAYSHKQEAGASFLTLAMNMIVMALHMKKFALKGWGWMLALGLLALINAAVIVANPLRSVALISASVCAELIVSGAHDVALAFQMKKLKSALKKK